MRPIEVAWSEHWYCCGQCGRWFGANYSDPHTGETLQAHVHNPAQLALFDSAVSV